MNDDFYQRLYSFEPRVDVEARRARRIHSRRAILDAVLLHGRNPLAEEARNREIERLERQGERLAELKKTLDATPTWTGLLQHAMEYPEVSPTIQGDMVVAVDSEEANLVIQHAVNRAVRRIQSETGVSESEAREGLTHRLRHSGPAQRSVTGVVRFMRDADSDWWNECPQCGHANEPPWSVCVSCGTPRD